jgi:predicted ATP-grasp superfamily ATP-dependent carboligase
VKPTALLLTSYRWPSSARIGMSFAEAGWNVEALCPRGHVFESTRSVGRLHRLHFFAIPSSIRRAIARSQADLLVPCDDLVAGHLHQMAATDSSSEFAALVNRSLGNAASYRDLYSRSRMAALATENGVAVPETEVIGSGGDLEHWIERDEFPFVLKVDRTSGGYGVRIVSTPAEARAAFAAISVPIDFPRALKRALVDRDTTYLMASLKRPRPVVNAQRFITGEEITCTCACWKGRLLACVVLRVLKTSSRVGCASVVQVHENPRVLEAVEKLIGRLQSSGIYGFDFIVDQATDQPFLLEINPRATQTTHLRTSAGSLASALKAALVGSDDALEPVYENGDTIALFPQERLRDPASDFLRSARDDTPWSEPAFVQACLERPKPTVCGRVFPMLTHAGLDRVLSRFAAL